MKKLSFKKLLENDRFLQVFSLVAAALCWLLVAMTQSYTTTEIIRNVPVEIDTQTGDLSNIGLHPIDSDSHTVDIEVEGLRSVVGRLSAEDFSIAARVSGVTEARIYDLPLTSLGTPRNSGYQIKSYSPATVRVRFDRIERRVFPVRGQINGLAIAPGYTEKATTVSPDTVSIEGPAAELDKISRCAITVELSGPLDRTYADDFDIILYDDNNQAIDVSEAHLTMDKTEARLTIQVLKIASLPLAVDYTALPAGFPLSELTARTKISQQEVTLAGPADIIDKMSSIHLGYLDLRSVTPENNTFSFNVPLPPPEDQFMRLDNVTSVAVTVDTAGLESARFNVTDMRIVNAPVGFNVQMLAKSLPNVQFVGRRDILASMTSDSIVAEADLSEREIESGSYSFPVKISVPGKGLVWAVGDHSVTIQVNSAVPGG